MSPREADECTLEELLAWAGAAERTRARDQLALIQGVFAGTAGTTGSRGGAEAFAAAQKQLLERLK